jgi:hypothetical protein
MEIDLEARSRVSARVGVATVGRALIRRESLFQRAWIGTNVSLPRMQPGNNSDVLFRTGRPLARGLLFAGAE